MTTREALTRIHAAAVEAVRGDVLLRRYARVERDTWRYEGPGATLEFALPERGSGGRVVVVGAGKAAAALAAGLEDSLGERLDEGAIVVKYGHGLPLRRIRVLEAGHPVPDSAGERATHEIVALLRSLRAGDCAFVLLTGGASALLVAPADGLTLADKAAVNTLLLRSAASIGEINAVRKPLSAVKGGRLAACAGEARLCTLAISDVPGDDPGTIGSGPTVPDASSCGGALEVLRRHDLEREVPQAVRAHLERGATLERAGAAGPARGPASAAAPWSAASPYVLLASNVQAQDAAARCARELGFDVRRFERPLTGETRAEARTFAAELRRVTEAPGALFGAGFGGEPILLLGGGETTLRVQGAGRGGRNQEFALECARALEGAGLRWSLLAAGTDGTDGPTDAAGAFVDEQTLLRAARAGLHAPAAQARNDCYPFFDVLGDLLRTGPTGTNVMDLVYATAGG